MSTEQPKDEDLERVEHEDWAQHEPDAPETEPDSQDEPNDGEPDGGEPDEGENPVTR